MSHYATQRMKVLHVLQSGRPIACFELSRVALCYTKRISELRADGWLIEKIEKHSGRQRNVSYKLLGKED